MMPAASHVRVDWRGNAPRYAQRELLSEAVFARLVDRAVLFHEIEGGAAVTKGDLLALCAASPQSAYRLYVACRCAIAPVAVLCRDLFEMPQKRRFPELAADFAAAPVTAAAP